MKIERKFRILSFLCSPLPEQSGKQSRVSLLAPWHIPLPCWRHCLFLYCWWSLSQGVQRDHVSQPINDSQLAISQVSLTKLDPSQLSGPRHSLVLERIPTPHETEHSDQSVQHDHCPSIAISPTELGRHECTLHCLVCTGKPSHGGDSHCLILCWEPPPQRRSQVFQADHSPHPLSIARSEYDFWFAFLLMQEPSFLQ